jgi:hypothetical protein
MCGPEQHRGLFPESTPPGLNYAVITGTLIGNPAEDRGPGGSPVTLLKIEFPVADPEHPRLLWTLAVYDVEVVGKVGRRDAEDLRNGAPVLVAGQLSERPGRAGAHGAIVATLVKPGPRSGRFERSR